jgi:ubiquinol-cytochrome c reductase cytochrome c subunit
MTIRRPPPLLAVTLLVAVVGWYGAMHLQRVDATGAPSSTGTGAQDDPVLVDQGEALYRVQCSSCHGLDGKGLRSPDGDLRGPSLENSGAAGAYYYLSTGRMPLANSEEIPRRKPPAYTDEEIAGLVAYVASLGDGPEIPDVDIANGDVAEGGELYRSNCAACHSATGAGGALSYGRAAPSLDEATPRQLGSAVRVGPGQMPRFGPDAITGEELDSVAAYVERLHQSDDRGGVALGRLGPIPEGFLVWIAGMGSLLVVCLAIGRRAGDTETTAEAEAE